MRKPDKKIVFVLNKVRRLLQTQTRSAVQPLGTTSFVNGSHLSFCGCGIGARQVDLVPKQVVADWLAYLRRFHPTIAFKAATQVRP